MAVSEPTLQQRLRATVHHERSAHLRGYGSPDAPEVGPKLKLLRVGAITYPGQTETAEHDRDRHADSCAGHGEGGRDGRDQKQEAEVESTSVDFDGRPGPARWGGEFSQAEPDHSRQRRNKGPPAPDQSP